MHQNGGYGSAGYGYSWKLADSQKNLLRTHTTAVSSRMLYRLAQDGFKPAKYFSIDRVFRNEAIDRTHLAEFHQVEGASQPPHLIPSGLFMRVPPPPDTLFPVSIHILPQSLLRISCAGFPSCFSAPIPF